MVEEVGGRTVVVVERGFWLMSSSVLPEKLMLVLKVRTLVFSLVFLRI